MVALLSVATDKKAITVIWFCCVNELSFSFPKLLNHTVLGTHSPLKTPEIPGYQYSRSQKEQPEPPGTPAVPLWA
jgi:hypothetical protein